MGLSDCSSCWETPCVCDNARGYRHLSINELKRLQSGITALIIDKESRKLDPDKREHSSR